MAEAGAEKFFPSLVVGLRAVQADGGVDISTRASADLAERIIRVFDHLGTVLSFAKADMHAKAESLRLISATHPTLTSVVQADIAAGTATVKNSCSRNLHRLCSVIKFLRLFLSGLMASPDGTLRAIATQAYTDSLAPIHSYIVKNAVWAGMYMLPTRAQFMASIGEDEASARSVAEEFVAGAVGVEASILALFGDLVMPPS